MANIARAGLSFFQNHGWEMAKSSIVLSGSIGITLSLERLFDQKWVFDQRWIKDGYSYYPTIVFATAVNAVAYAVSHVMLRELVWPWLLEDSRTKELRKCNAECEQAAEALEKAHYDFKKNTNINLQVDNKSLHIRIINLETGLKNLESDRNKLKGKRDVFTRTSILNLLDSIDSRTEEMEGWLTKKDLRLDLALNDLTEILKKNKQEAANENNAWEKENSAKTAQEKSKANKETDLKANEDAEREQLISIKTEEATYKTLDTTRKKVEEDITKLEGEIRSLEANMADSKLENALRQANAAYYINEQEAEQGAYKSHNPPTPSVLTSIESIEESMKSLGELSLEQLGAKKLTLTAQKGFVMLAKAKAEEEWVKTAKEITTDISKLLNRSKNYLNALRTYLSTKTKTLTDNKTTVIEKLTSDNKAILEYQEKLSTKIAKKRTKYPAGNNKIPPLEIQYKKESDSIAKNDNKILKAERFFDSLISILQNIIRDINDLNIIPEKGEGTIPSKLNPSTWAEAENLPPLTIDRSLITLYRKDVYNTVQDAVIEFSNLNILNRFLDFKFNEKIVDIKKAIDDLKEYEARLNDNASIKEKYQRLKKNQQTYLEKVRDEEYFSNLLSKVMLLHAPMEEKHKAYKKKEEELRLKKEGIEKNLTIDQKLMNSAKGRHQALVTEQTQIADAMASSLKKKKQFEDELAKILKTRETKKDEIAQLDNQIKDIEKRLKAHKQKEAKAWAKVEVVELTIKRLAQLDKLDKDFKDALDKYDKADDSLKSERENWAKKTGASNEKLPIIQQAQDDKRKELETAKNKRLAAVENLAITNLKRARFNVLTSIVAKCQEAGQLYGWKILNLNKTSTKRFEVHQATSRMIEAKIDMANLKRHEELKEALLTPKNPKILKTIELEYALAIYQQKKHQLDQQWRAADNNKEKDKIRKTLLECMKTEEELLYNFFVSKVARGPKKNQTPERRQALREKCATKVVIGVVGLILDKMLTERIRGKEIKPQYPYQTTHVLNRYLTEHMNLIKKKDACNNISSKELLILSKKLKEIKTNEALVPVAFTNFLDSLKKLAEIKEDIEKAQQENKEDIANEHHKKAISKLNELKNIKGEELSEKYQSYLNKIKMNEALPPEEFPKFLGSIKSLAELKDDIVSKNHVKTIDKLKTIKDINVEYLVNSYSYFLDSINTNQKKECEIALKAERKRVIDILINELDVNAIRENKYLKLLNEFIEEKDYTVEIVINKIDKLQEEIKMTKLFHEEILNVKYNDLTKALETNVSHNSDPRAIIKTFGGILDSIAEKHVNLLKTAVLTTKLSLIQQYNDKPYLEDYENELDKFSKNKNKYREDKYNLKKEIETSEEKYTNEIIKEKKLSLISSSEEKSFWIGIAEKVSYYIIPAIFLWLHATESMKQAPTGNGKLSFRSGMMIWGMMTGIHLYLQSIFPRANMIFKKALFQS